MIHGLLKVYYANRGNKKVTVVCCIRPEHKRLRCDVTGRPVMWPKIMRDVVMVMVM